MKLKVGDLVRLKKSIQFCRFEGYKRIESLYYDRLTKTYLYMIRMRSNVMELGYAEYELELKKNHPHTKLFK